jgi:hypothetical protein
LRVKIFSVRAYENFKVIRIGEDTRRLSTTTYVECEIQQFLDQHPNMYIRHVAFSTMVIIPQRAVWHPTNRDIEEMQDDASWKMARRVP